MTMPARPLSQRATFRRPFCRNTTEYNVKRCTCVHFLRIPGHVTYAYCARYSSTIKVMAEYESVVLASFVAQCRGLMFYELQVCRATRGDRVFFVRRPDDRHNANSLEVRIACDHRSYMLGHLAAEVAAHLVPLLCDHFLQASG